MELSVLEKGQVIVCKPLPAVFLGRLGMIVVFREYLVEIDRTPILVHVVTLLSSCREVFVKQWCLPFVSPKRE